MNLNIPEILKCYHSDDADRTQLYREYEVRAEQIYFWNIQPGWRILEVGCWAGDMSIILAAAAGEQGQVVAVDILPADSPYRSLCCRITYVKRRDGYCQSLLAGSQNRVPVGRRSDG